MLLEASSILETLMVVFFGLSWPLNIIKAWKARTARGTSILFYSFIWVGYICAIAGKLCLIYYHINIAHTAQHWWEVVKWYAMFFYVLNTAMVTSGIFIYFRNVRLDRKEAEKAAKRA